MSAFYGEIVKLRIGESGSTYLVDGAGRVVYHSDPDRIGADFSEQPVVQRVVAAEVGAVRTQDLEGVDIVAGFAPVRGTSWGLVTEESWAALTSGSQGYQRFLLLLLVLGVAVPAAVVAVGLRRVMRPIEELIHGAREVAAGNFRQEIGPRSRDEIGELAREFNVMAAELKDSYEHLEQRVAERTKELLESEERRQRVVTGAPIVLFALDRDGVFTLSEGQGLSALRLGPGEVVGRSALEMYRDVPGVVESIRRALSGEEIAASVEVDGLTFDSRYSPLKDDDGNVSGVIGVATDITDRRRAVDALRESEQRYRTLFEQSRDAIFVANEGRIVDANQAALDLFGYTREEAVGVDTGLVYADASDQAKFREAVNTHGAVREFEVRLRRKNGDIIDCLMTAALQRDEKGDRVGVQGIVRDITERKRAERALQASLEEKERLLTELRQLYDQERRRAEQTRAINEMALEVSSVLSLEELLTYVPDALRRSFDYYNVNIFLLEPDSDRLVLRAGTDRADGAGRTGEKLGLEERSIVGWVAKTGRVLLANDVTKESRFLFVEHLEGTRAELAVPIKMGDDVLGVLDIQSTELDAFDETDQFTALSLANQLAVAIENARLFDQTRDLAVLEERNRMAREIHDTLAQGFTGISLQLEAAEQASEESPAETMEHIARSKAVARESLQEARRSVWNLLPKALEQQSLNEALQDEVSRFAAGGGTSASFDLSGHARKLSPEAQAALLRICQEALTNVRKHAGATEVNVELAFSSQSVSMRVRDNGVGFERRSPNGDGQQGGFGLTGMEQRAGLLQGTLDVRSANGRGTVVEVTIPAALGT